MTVCHMVSCWVGTRWDEDYYVAGQWEGGNWVEGIVIGGDWVSTLPRCCVNTVAFRQHKSSSTRCLIAWTDVIGASGCTVAKDRSTCSGYDMVVFI